MSRYVQRLGRAFEALQVLDLYPRGISVEDLAEVLNAPAKDIVAELGAYNDGTERPEPEGEPLPYVEFLRRQPLPGEDSDDLYVSAAEAAYLRLGGAAGGSGAGMSVADFGAVLVAAQDLLRTEPDNTALAEVVAEIRARWLPGLTGDLAAASAREHVGALRQAVEEELRVRITYERWWRPGTIDRVIEPYQLVRTRRGFEVDAGPVDDEGSIRTYIVDQITDLEVLDETFSRPADAQRLCDAHRSTTEVTIIVPRGREWATEDLSENVQVGDRDTDTVLTLEVIEPLRQRVGLVVLQTGPGAFVLDPPELQDAAGELAAELLKHHGLE